MSQATRTALMFALGCSSLLGADLPPALQAKFIKILASSAGSPGKVACNSNPELQGELTKAGVTPDPGCKVAWGSTEAEVKALKGAGKLVICGKSEWLSSGGAIAIIEEGGKPQIYLQMTNISASGVTLSDAVLKIGKKI